MNPSKAIAFDVDPASLRSLREALPEWEVEAVQDATAASLARKWRPGAADLLVVGFRGNGRETLGLCRLLTFCTPFSAESRQELAETWGLNRSLQNGAQRNGAPRNGTPPDGTPRNGMPRADAALLVLVPPGEETFVGAALEAGAHSCLMLPIHAQDVASTLVHAHADTQKERERWHGIGG
jgi:hypothetical protein